MTERSLHTVVDKIDGHTLVLYRGVNADKARQIAKDAGPGAIARTLDTAKVARICAA